MKALNIILKYIFPLFLNLLFMTGCNENDKKLTVFCEFETAQTDFAIAEIAKVCNAKGIQLRIKANKDADMLIKLDSANSEIEPEGFTIEVNPNQITISSVDAAGAMYGGLELAEQIQIYGIDNIKPTKQNPYMAMRGAKFNIPLDARTPSYTDACDAAQNNISEMWNFDFWTEYIDNMARYRYNFISLWSLHPFPSLVKLNDYPDIALNDVHKSTVKWSENYHLHGTGLDAPEILNNYQIIKEISINEKIEFWKKIMAYAKSRNVDMYFVTWNIFTNGTFNKYGITDNYENETTKDYFRKSVKQMFITYPDLAGIGLTTGENMVGVKFDQKEQWAFDTYAQGVLDAVDELPDRKIRFIHRQHMADPTVVEAMFKPLIDNENVDFVYSFKYAKAHVFSSTKQPYHEEFEKNIGKLKTIWTLRNDDSYIFRWGSPIFTREFIQNIPQHITQGMYYGSDQWIWGREFTSRNVEEPRELEVVKHWYNWMQWGRLSYNPQLGNDRFIAILQARFPETNAQTLFEAWPEASMVYPVTTGFHWGPVDFTWYIEGCKSRPGPAFNETGFHDVNTFIKFPTHPYSGYQSIPDFVNDQLTGTKTELKTPLEVAQLLHNHADKAMKLVGELENDSNGAELKQTIHDIKTIAAMGKYYAHKITGSTHYAMYKATGQQNSRQQAINELTLALEKWKVFADFTTAQNIDQIWTNRVGYVNWQKTTQWVEQDMAIVKNYLKISSTRQTTPKNDYFCNKSLI